MTLLLASACSKPQSEEPKPPVETTAVAQPGASADPVREPSPAEEKSPVTVLPVWKEIILAALKPQIPDLQDCYNQALRRLPDIDGRVFYTFIVKVDGTTDRVEAEPDGTLPQPMIDCTVALIQSWTFPMEGAPRDEDVSFEGAGDHLRSLAGCALMLWMSVLGVMRTVGR